MAMPYAVDASPFKFFRPLNLDPPTSLAQDIHPSKPVNCLLLDCGDPRDILFTLWNDEDKRKNEALPGLIVLESENPRTYDFTCCNVEAGIIGIPFTDELLIYSA